MIDGWGKNQSVKLLWLCPAIIMTFLESEARKECASYRFSAYTSSLSEWICLNLELARTLLEVHKRKWILTNTLPSLLPQLTKLLVWLLWVMSVSRKSTELYLNFQMRENLFSIVAKTFVEISRWKLFARNLRKIGKISTQFSPSKEKHRKNLK
jgi:hypothetical protein